MSALSLTLTNSVSAQTTFDLENLLGDTPAPLECDPFVDPGCNLAPTGGPGGCTDCMPGQNDFGSFIIEDQTIIFEPRQLGDGSEFDQLFEQVTPDLLEQLKPGPASGF